jgi:opacity protein-like surface antigen
LSGIGTLVLLRKSLWAKEGENLKIIFAIYQYFLSRNGEGLSAVQTVTMRTVFLRGLLFSLLISPLTFAGQIFSIGVKAGLPFTDAFNSFTSGSYRSFSDSKNYIVGPMVELHLPLGLSVEADALYRPLSFSTQSQLGTGSTDFSSWEFPILAKYRFPIPLVKPYVEAGPSFRTVHGTFGSNFSNSGFTAGVGIELRLARFRIGPEIRYTHWGADANVSPQAFSSNQNQGEFLVGFSF